MSVQKQVDAQQILCSSRIGLWRVDFENGHSVRLYADEQMDELLGTSAEMTPEQRQDFFTAHIHPDDRELFEEYAARLKEVNTEIVYRYLHPITGEMVVRCSGHRDLTVTDHITSIGTHQDISGFMRLEQSRTLEHRLAEQNLSLRREQVQQENYYRELLDIQNCGLLAYTLSDYRVVHINAEARRICSLRDIRDAEEHLERLGGLLGGVYYPDKESIQKLIALRSEDGSVDYECVINQGREEECHVMARSKTIHLVDGERAVVTTFLDMSDMATLRRALQQAEAGSRAKSSFLFAMSHDLRTPMNAIIGYADLIESHWGQKEASWEYLQKLKESSRFLLSLIGNILEVSRIESGKETLHEAPWDLRGMEELVDVLLESELSNKLLNVTRQVNLEKPFVLCDSMKLREILMNLLSNAVKYTPTGGSIHLTLEERPDHRPDYIRFCASVTDNGIGIAEEYIPHLFEAFSRERDSSESGILGTGLGLRIVKSFVDLMGGTVSVQSTYGKGSCFAVEIPLRCVAESEQPAVLPHLPEPVSMGKWRILLAEDNALNAEIATTVLEDAGLEVEQAGDGQETLDKLKATPEGYYDLILMDIQMPRMNGYEAARAIRALPDSRARTLIIAMTANAFEEDRQAAYDAGMDGYAAKPIETARLLQVLAQAMQNRREGGAGKS